MEAEELKAIEGPLSLAAAGKSHKISSTEVSCQQSPTETDEVFPRSKRHESEEILLSVTSLPYQISLYSGTTHGFAVRGDISVKSIKFAKEQAFFQALAWFEEHMVE